jgi:hypothetical protein
LKTILFQFDRFQNFFLEFAGLSIAIFFLSFYSTSVLLWNNRLQIFLTVSVGCWLGEEQSCHGVGEGGEGTVGYFGAPQFRRPRARQSSQAPSMIPSPHGIPAASLVLFSSAEYINKFGKIYKQ